MNKVRLSVDLDDTLADTIAEWTKEASTKLGREVRKEELTEYHLENVIELNHKTITEIFRDIWNNYNRVPLLDRCIPKVISDLRDLFEIFIITAAVGSRSDVSAWLEKYKINYDKLIMVEHSKDKLDLSNEYGISVFVDDNPILADMVISSNKKVVMIKQPWNTKFIDEHVSKNLFAVSNWIEAESALKRISDEMGN
ncbi:MAG: 5' nucleotidase, NT5C type [Candidatus Micrarchaeia archaeon]